MEEEVVYGLTSLNAAVANVARLLDLSRRHWSIENGLHHRRDVTFGEDACRVRKGSGPQVLAALRNALIHLLARHAAKNFAAALRRFSTRPREALDLLRKTTEN